MTFNDLEGALENFGFFEDGCDLQVWQDGAQVVSSDKDGHAYAEDGYDLKDILACKVLSFYSNDAGSLVVCVEGAKSNA
jgi:hypothetical protein